MANDFENPKERDAPAAEPDQELWPARKVEFAGLFEQAMRVGATDPHDGAWKLMLGEQVVSAGMLRSLGAAWVDELDLNSLEREPTEQVGDDLKRRVNDLVWRVRRKGDGVVQHIHLVFELQSSVDQDMALRMVDYSCAKYKEMRRRLGAGRCAPVLSVVLHTGDGAWTAPRDIAELIEPVPKSMRHLVVRQAYELLELRVPPGEGVADEANLAQAILAEGRGTEAADILAAHQRVWRLLAGQPRLQKVYIPWSRYNLCRRLRRKQIDLPAQLDDWPKTLEGNLMKFGAKLERKLTKQITERVTEQVTEQVLDGQRGTVVAAVRDRFGEAAAAQAQAFLAGIKSGDAVLAAYRWALTSRSRSELMDRLATA